MKRKMLALCLVAVLLCGFVPFAMADGGDVTELTVWCWTQDFNLYAINEANAIYQQDHPNVKVTPVDVPWDDLQSKLITSLSSGATDGLPDILLMQDTAAQKNIMTYPEAFYDLTDLMDLSNFADYKLSVTSVDGHNYGVPFDSGVGANFLRTDYIEQAGLTLDDFNDVTWDQYIELAKQVKESSGMPLVSYSENSLELVTMIMQSSGSWYFNADGTVNIANNEALKAAIDVVKRMNEAGIVRTTVDWNEYTSSIVSGDVGGVLNAVWMVSIMTAAEDQSGLWGAAKFPRLDGFDGARNATSNGGSSWFVMSSSPNADIAVDFLDKTFNGSVSFYDAILPTAGAVATWIPAAQSAIYQEPVDFFGGQKVYADIVEWGNEVPPVFTGMYIYEAQDAIARAFVEILGGADVDSALQNAENTVNFLIEE